MDLDLSFITGNSESATTNAPERPRTHTEPPQSLNPSNYTPSTQNTVQRTLDPTESELAIKAAKRILDNNKVNREATDGIMKQIEIDLAAHKDPCTLLLYAAEALDRISGRGDGYIKRIEQALKQNGYI